MPISYYVELAKVMYPLYKTSDCRAGYSLMKLLSPYVMLNLQSPEIDKIKNKAFKYLIKKEPI